MATPTLPLTSNTRSNKSIAFLDILTHKYILTRSPSCLVAWKGGGALRGAREKIFPIKLANIGEKTYFCSQIKKEDYEYSFAQQSLGLYKRALANS